MSREWSGLVSWQRILELETNIRETLGFTILVHYELCVCDPISCLLSTYLPFSIMS